MPILQDTAVTLHRLDFSETSQVLVLFGRGQGKVRAIAKGIRRSTKTRFAVGVDLLELGEVSLSVRQAGQEALATITAWRQRSAFTGLREKLPRIHAAEYAAEVTAALTEDWDPHVDLFDALVELLRRLADAPEAVGPLLAFQLRLLGAIGSLPRFDVCVVCGRGIDAGTIYFSSHEGGLLCRDCEAARTEKRQVNPASLPWLRAEVSALSTQHSALTTQDSARTAAGAFDVLNYHLSHLMGRAPKLAEHVVDPRAARTFATG